MQKSWRVVLGVLAGATALASPAHAAGEVGFLPAEQRTLTAAATTDGRCDSFATTGAGTARSVWTAPMAGYVTVRLHAGDGDWDLGLFDASGRRLAGSMAFGSHELAHAWVTAGDQLTIQGCRRSGDATQAAVAITLADADFPAATTGTPQLVRVAYDDSADLQKIADLGLDLTHHIHDGKADVIVAD